jgi:hypothetical protein
LATIARNLGVTLPPEAARYIESAAWEDVQERVARVSVRKDLDHPPVAAEDVLFCLNMAQKLGVPRARVALLLAIPPAVLDAIATTAGIELQ